MRKLLLILLAVFLVTGLHAYYDFGAGIIVGKPTGIKLKYNSNPYSAISSTLAWDLLAQKAHMTLVFDYNFLIKDESGKHYQPFFLYTGFGGRALFENDPRLGIMFSLGGSFRPSDMPFELFAEASPILDLYPATGFDMDGGLGFIFYFF